MEALALHAGLPLGTLHVAARHLQRNFQFRWQSQSFGHIRFSFRNALSHQNKMRPCVIGKEYYLSLHQHLGQQVGLSAHYRGLPGVGRRNVCLLDSSLITLCARLFGWANDSTEKRSVKLYTLFGLSDFLPKHLNRYGKRIISELIVSCRSSVVSLSRTVVTVTQSCCEIGTAWAFVLLLDLRRP